MRAEWIPDSGFHLRKAGVQFDAVRVDGDDGRRLADLMEELVGGEPGPVVTESNGRRGVYFLVPHGLHGRAAVAACGDDVQRGDRPHQLRPRTGARG